MFVMNDGQISHLTFSPDVLYLRQDLRSYFCSLSTMGLPKAVRDAIIEKTYQVFFESPGKGFKSMGLVVVIPQDYEKLPEALRKRIVPICIAAYDHNGQLIAPDWFWRGVAPVHKQLVGMARFMLGDPWCVSELAEAVVHKLWARYGSALGAAPQRRVLKKAMREAREINIGDWRKRKKPQFYLALATLDEKVREHVLADPHQWPALFERELLLDTYEERLGREGRAQMQQAFHLLRLGHNWDTIAVRVGEKNPDNLKHRFHRWAKKMGSA